MKITGTLAEVKSVSKLLRKFGWTDEHLQEREDVPGTLTLTVSHASVSPSQDRRNRVESEGQS